MNNLGSQFKLLKDLLPVVCKLLRGKIISRRRNNSFEKTMASLVSVSLKIKVLIDWEAENCLSTLSSGLHEVSVSSWLGYDVYVLRVLVDELKQLP